MNRIVLAALFLLSPYSFGQTQVEINAEKTSDLSRLSALRHFSIWISNFKTSYPQFSTKDEGQLRKYVYETYGTDAIMSRMEELELIEVNKAKEAEAIENKLKNIAFGIEVMAYFSYLNAGTTMTQEQIFAYSQIKLLLETGAIEQSRGYIANLPTDDEFLTVEKKAKVLAKLDSYLPTM